MTNPQLTSSSVEWMNWAGQVHRGHLGRVNGGSKVDGEYENAIHQCQAKCRRRVRKMVPASISIFRENSYNLLFLFHMP